MGDSPEEGREADRLHAFVEQSTDVITVLRPDGTIQYESPSVEHVLGYDQAALVGENAFEYVHPEDREGLMQTFQAAVADPETTPTAEYRFRHADGSWTWVESRGNNQLDNPAVEGFVVNTRDISDRVAHEQELERVRNRMEFALRSTDALVWDWNVDEDHATFYPSEAEFYGTSVDSLDHFIELVHPEDRQEVRESIQQALDTGEQKEEQLRIVNDGEVRWIEAPGEPLQDDDGTTRMIGVVRDITERKRDKEELQRKNEQLEEFTSVVSHDLRNPLNVAQGRLELAQDECDSEHLDHVAQAHERMTALIDDLLTLARADERTTDVKPVSLAPCLDTCWENVDTADATLVVETDLTVEADWGQLCQLFENLFRNAVEHGGEEVTVTVDDLDDGFYVEDDGPGIPAAKREAAFSAGYSSNEGGTGFGLRIVTRVAEAHGWGVGITDGSEGGARFEITGVDDVEE
jgi:PAS domain S-box-containing protein